MAKKILIIEDEEMLLKILVDQFKAEGFTVLSANNGEDGLKLATTKSPDIMLVDLLLPRMNGLTMIERTRDTEGKNIPAIVLTNLSDVDTAAKALSLGAAEYMVKTDWELSDVVKKVKDTLHLY